MEDIKYVMIHWIDGNPLIDGSMYFDSKEECLNHIKYIEEIVKQVDTKLESTFTMCRLYKYRQQADTNSNTVKREDT